MLTVLLATKDRAHILSAVLESYEKLKQPRGGWQLVVVDNGSADHTAAVLSRFTSRLPLTTLREPTPGKNAALNAGLAHVAGDLVILADDDAFPHADWLLCLREAADVRETFDLFGGTVLPMWESPPPEWVRNCVPAAPTFTVSDSSLPEGPVEGHHLFGPNMAVRAAVFDAGHRFDPTIGPSPSNGYAMGSETEFILRLEKRGMRAWYVPEAVVEHLVRTEQMRWSWIIARAARFGRGQCRLGRPLPPPPTPGCFGFALPLLLRLCRKAAATALAGLLLNRERLFRAAWALSYVWGYTSEARASFGRINARQPPAREPNDRVK